MKPATEELNRKICGEGPPLLLLHGVTRRGADWDPLVPVLSSRWRVIAPDQRGHGDSGIAMPSLDRLRGQSVEREHFHVSPVCSPTPASLLTARDHLRLRVLTTPLGLEVMIGEEVTLAEALQRADPVSGCFSQRRTPFVVNTTTPPYFR